MIEFYSENAPEKLSSVSKIIRDYKGKEELLVTKLTKKYGTTSTKPLQMLVESMLLQPTEAT